MWERRMRRALHTVCETGSRTALDPFLPFEIDPMNGRIAPLSGRPSNKLENASLRLVTAL